MFRPFRHGIDGGPEGSFRADPLRGRGIPDSPEVFQTVQGDGPALVGVLPFLRGGDRPPDVGGDGFHRLEGRRSRGEAFGGFHGRGMVGGDAPEDRLSLSEAVGNPGGMLQVPSLADSRFPGLGSGEAVHSVGADLAEGIDVHLESRVPAVPVGNPDKRVQNVVSVQDVTHGRDTGQRPDGFPATQRPACHELDAEVEFGHVREELEKLPILDRSVVFPDHAEGLSVVLPDHGPEVFQSRRFQHSEGQALLFHLPVEADALLELEGGKLGDFGSDPEGAEGSGAGGAVQSDVRHGSLLCPLRGGWWFRALGVPRPDSYKLRPDGRKVNLRRENLFRTRAG